MTTRRKPRIHYDRDQMVFIVTFPCCESRPMKLHEWATAIRIGNGHECPKHYIPVAFSRRGVRHPATRKGTLS